MFKSLEYICDHGYRFGFTIVDTDFTDYLIVEQRLVITDRIHQDDRAAIVAIIQCYSQRGLNVAGNLALAIQYINHRFGVNVDAGDVPIEYEEGVSKYLLLT